MGLCRDCKHYEPFEVWWDTVGKEAYDTKEELASGYYQERGREMWRVWEWGRCLLTATEGSKAQSGTLAAAYDVDNYEADLRCSPDFGCLQFEEDAELVNYEEVVELNFESRYQLAYTEQGRAFEHRWREFGGDMPDYDYGWRRTPENDKPK